MRRSGGHGKALTRSATTVLAALAVLAAGGTGVAQSDAAVAPTAATTPTVSPSAARTVTVPAAPGVTIGGVDHPDPLRSRDGDAVTTPESWEAARRDELLADFRRNVYGQSLPKPTRQTSSVTTTTVGTVERKIVKITLTGPQGSRSFTLRLFVPKTGTPPRGTFLMIDHRGSVTDSPNQSSEYAPVSKITAAGYAFASFDANDIAPDDSESYRSKMIGLFHPSGAAMPADAGRTISAWAWGASRAMDHLATDPDIDPDAVAVIGHSRGGKASLWAGAQDTRFAAVITNDSGSTGAKLARRGDGGVGAETVSRINDAFPHWFPQTYKAFNDRESSLPVDQHQLLALVAPRRVVVASATEDSNADPKGEFLSYVAAAKVYELYGLGDTGLPSTTWKPATDKDFRGPAMSYHLRSGGHGLLAADWDIYLKGRLFSR